MAAYRRFHPIDLLLDSMDLQTSRKSMTMAEMLLKSSDGSTSLETDMVEAILQKQSGESIDIDLRELTEIETAASNYAFDSPEAEFVVSSSDSGKKSLLPIVIEIDTQEVVQDENKSQTNVEIEPELRSSTVSYFNTDSTVKDILLQHNQPRQIPFAEIQLNTNTFIKNSPKPSGDTVKGFMSSMPASTAKTPISSPLTKVLSPGISSPRTENFATLLREQGEKLSQLEYQNMTATEECVKLQGDVKEKENIISAQSTEIEKLKSSLMSAGGDNKKNNGSIVDMQNEVEKLKIEVDDAKFESESLNARVERLNTDSTTLRADLRSTKMELNSNHLDLNDWKGKYEIEHAEVQAKCEQVDALSATQSESLSHSTKLQSEIQVLKTRLSTLEVEKAALTRDKMQLVEENSMYKKQVSVCIQQIDESETILRQKSAESIRIEQKCQHFERQLSRLNNSNNDEEIKARNSFDENESLRRKLAYADNEIASMSANLHKKMETIAVSRDPYVHVMENSNAHSSVAKDAQTFNKPHSPKFQKPMTMEQFAVRRDQNQFDGVQGSQTGDVSLIKSNTIDSDMISHHAKPAASEYIKPPVSNRHHISSISFDHGPVDSKPAPPPSVQATEPRINLSNWRSEGYPSEYAYAQAMGELQIRRGKPPEIQSTVPAQAQHLSQAPPYSQNASASNNAFKASTDSDAPWATESSSVELAKVYDETERVLTTYITEKTNLKDESDRLHQRGGRTLKERTRLVQVEYRLDELEKEISNTRKKLLARPQ